MEKIDFVAQLSALAEAAYLDLDPTQALDGQLKPLPPELANRIVEDWNVVAATGSDLHSGFASTLFENKDGAYVFAIRGTEKTSASDMAADFGDLVLDGIAVEQLVDMYNTWQRYTHGAETNNNYTSYSLTLIGDSSETVSSEAERLGYILLNDIVGDELKARWYKLTADERTDGLGIIGPESQVYVTGHSLGGSLAAAFTRLFPGIAKEAVMINGAGIAADSSSNYVAELFSQLGGASAFDTSVINNFTGTAGLEVVTGDEFIKQPGNVVEVETESSNIFSTSLGHGVEQMTDTLSLMGLLQVIDQETTVERANKLLLSAGDDTDQQLEDTLGIIAKVLGVDISSEKYSNLEAAGRDAFYGYLNTVYEKLLPYIGSTQIVELGGMSADEIATKVKSDSSLMLALFNLSSFAIGGIEHNDIKLFQYSADTGAGSLTGAWVADRAKMLSMLIAFRELDSPEVAEESYYDIESGTSIFSTSGLAGARIVFGSNESGDSLEGGSGDDHLYGGAGNDKILGDIGNDYIEGGLGADELEGGLGDDTINGMDGDDILKGGSGSDLLEGGLGFDIYRFTSGDGKDVVSDIDGKGQIDLAALHAAKLTRVSDDSFVWRTDDDRVTVSFVGKSLSESGTLFISYGPEDLIQINNFNNGSLGITLPEIQSGNIPSDGPFIIEGDILTVEDSAYDHYGNVLGSAHSDPGKYDALQGSTGIDYIYGYDGQDAIVADDGDDIVEGGLGRDFIAGGRGDDTLFADSRIDPLYILSSIDPTDQDSLHGDVISGDEGDDILVGSTQSDWLDGGEGKDTIYGGNGDDIIYGDSSVVIRRGLDWAHYKNYTDDPTARIDTAGYVEIEGDGFLAPDNFGQADLIYSGDGNDLVWSEGGDDTVDGGAGNDWIMGGAGSDLLIGGSGNDKLNSASNRATNTSDKNEVYGGEGNDIIWGDGGSDYLDGGDGDDLIFGSTSTALQSDADADVIYGGLGNDTLSGGAGADQLYGGIGADILFGGLGDDVLDGGEGEDVLRGGAGHDIYQVNVGDIVLDDIGESVINLEMKFDPEKFRVFAPNDGDPKLMFFSGEDPIFTAVGNIENFTFNFASGESFQAAELIAYFSLVPVTENAVSIAGVNTGTQLDDTLRGGYGDEVWKGNAGDDNIVGNGDNDTFLYGLGDGHDTVSQTSGSFSIKLDDSILSSEVKFYIANDGALVLGFQDGGSITVTNYADNAAVIGEVVFSDGTKYGDSQLRQFSTLLKEGTADDDVIYGTARADIISAGEGNDFIAGQGGSDVVYGGEGKDTYLFDRSGGQLSIVETSGAESIIQLSQISRDSIFAHRENDDLVVGSSTTGTSIRIVDYYNGEQTVSVVDRNGSVALETLLASNNYQQSLLTADERFRKKFTNANLTVLSEIGAQYGASVVSGEEITPVLNYDIANYSYSRYPGYGGDIPSNYTTSQYSSINIFRTVSESVSIEVNGEFGPGDDYALYRSVSQTLGAVTISATATWSYLQSSSSSKVYNQAAYQTYIVTVKGYGNGDDLSEGNASNVIYHDYVYSVPSTQNTYVERVSTDTYSATLSDISIQDTADSDSVAPGTNTVIAAATSYEIGTRDVLLRGGSEDDYIDISNSGIVLDPQSYGYNSGFSLVRDKVSIFGGEGDDRVGYMSYPTSDDLRGVGVLLSGGAGEDRLYGSQYGDWLSGGIGNNFLNGAGGSDSYFFSLEDVGSTSLIDDTGRALDTELGPDLFATDTVLFDIGITIDQLKFSVISDDDGVPSYLKVRWAEGSVISIPIASDGDRLSYGVGIERFEFADQTSISFDQALAMASIEPKEIYLGTVSQSGLQPVLISEYGASVIKLPIADLLDNVEGVEDAHGLKLYLSSGGKLTEIKSFKVVDNSVVVSGVISSVPVGIFVGGEIYDVKDSHDFQFIISGQDVSGNVSSLVYDTEVPQFSSGYYDDSSNQVYGYDGARNALVNWSSGAVFGGDQEDYLGNGTDQGYRDGKEGADTYFVSLHDNTNVIIEDTGTLGNDALVISDAWFDESAYSSMYFSMSGEDLSITSTQNGGAIIIKDWENHAKYDVLAYNEVLSHQQIDNLVSALAAFSGSDSMPNSLEQSQKAQVSELVMAAFADGNYQKGSV
ncbi:MULTISPECIES: hypothetical protein [unclassified Pseudomonas]|uniref:hypothetical protein n=1 Tax=unclassified Pseudomonas TaxID=196821 RepID=UPI00131B8F31|nr:MULTISPECIES: hypothetical protein [unclassified Pseudomonas]